MAEASTGDGVAGSGDVTGAGLAGPLAAEGPAGATGPTGASHRARGWRALWGLWEPIDAEHHDLSRIDDLPDGERAPVALVTPLWRALCVYRVLALGYAVIRFSLSATGYAHPTAGWSVVGVMGAWTLFTAFAYTRPALRVRLVLLLDMLVAVLCVLATRWLDTGHHIDTGAVTLPTVWSAGPALAWAVAGGWAWGAGGALVTGVSDLVERGAFAEGDIHNSVLLFLAATTIGIVVGIARRSELVMLRALRMRAATRERERLARDIHDGVLQVLALVQRRGAELGGDAAGLGRLAGEQEVALRRLMASAPLDDTDEDRCDVGGLLHALATRDVTVSSPGTPVLLPGPTARELAAAVAAALDNVHRHAGPGAGAWVLLEEVGAEVVVSVRDDGPGIPEGRLAAARAEGRLGVVQSIEGRMRDIGGSAGVVSVAGEGTEVELRLPRQATGRTIR